MPAPDTEHTEPFDGYDFQTAPIVHEWPEVRGLRVLACASETSPGTLLLCIESRATGRRHEITKVFGANTSSAMAVGTIAIGVLEAAAGAWMGDAVTWQ